MNRGCAGALVAAVLTLAACGPELAPSSTVPTPAAATTVKVLAVVDGDTLDVDMDGRRQRLRLLGIDAPEIAHGQPAQCGGAVAAEALRRLAYRKTVTIQADPRADEEDRYGRLLAYVTIGPLDLGFLQVERGYAEAWHPRGTSPPSRFEDYRAAADRARAARVGAWATCPALGR